MSSSNPVSAGNRGGKKSTKKDNKAVSPTDDASSSASVSISEEESDAEDDSSADDDGRVFTFELSNLKDGATGKVVIQTRPSWAPLGVEHFHQLMDDHFYDQAKFFRVVKDFIVQFGIAAVPKNNRRETIKDDPVEQTNARGTVTFATSGADTRTTQLFINTRKRGNQFLDKQGFAPIAEVIR